MKDGSKKMLVGAGVALAAMSALTVGAGAVSNLLLHLALDRKMPRMITNKRERLTGEAAGYSDALLQAERAARYLHRCGCVRVELTARDGTRLVGHWYENPYARRVLVAMHGWRSRWDQDFGLIAPFLHEKGCSVLYAEQRGQNDSGGSHMTFGLLERYDCLEWVRWVQEHTMPGLPVYLAGVSMGATTVLLAAGQELPACVKGVIADCGFTSPHAIWKHVAERNLHLNYALHQSWVDWLCRRRLQMELGSASTVDALRACRVPVLFIHGSDDSFVPVEMTYENYKACAGPKELLIVPGAGHAVSYLTEKERYERALMDFWRKWERI